MPGAFPVGRARDTGAAIPMPSPARGAQREPQQEDLDKVLNTAVPWPACHEKRRGKGWDEHSSEDTSQMLKMTKFL